MSVDTREASIAAQNAANVAAALLEAFPHALESTDIGVIMEAFDSIREHVLQGTLAAIGEHGTAPAKASNVRKFAPKKAAAKKAGGDSEVPDLEGCEVCGGALWDNREDKKTAKSPDFRCKAKDECGAAHWWRDGEWQTG